jgi:hypothetical protein
VAYHEARRAIDLQHRPAIRARYFKRLVLVLAHGTIILSRLMVVWHRFVLPKRAMPQYSYSHEQIYSLFATP